MNLASNPANTVLVFAIVSLPHWVASASAQQANGLQQTQDAIVHQLETNYRAMAATLKEEVSKALTSPELQASLLQELGRARQNQIDLSAKFAEPQSDFDKAFHREQDVATPPRAVELVGVTTSPPVLRNDPNDMYFPYKSTMTVTVRIHDEFGQFTIDTPVRASPNGVWKAPSSSQITQQIKAQCDNKGRELQSSVDETKRRYEQLRREAAAKLVQPH